jgi:hypothetical protein
MSPGLTPLRPCSLGTHAAAQAAGPALDPADPAGWARPLLAGGPYTVRAKHVKLLRRKEEGADGLGQLFERELTPGEAATVWGAQGAAAGDEGGGGGPALHVPAVPEGFRAFTYPGG